MSVDASAMSVLFFQDILIDGHPVSEVHVPEGRQDEDITQLSALDDDTSQSHTFSIQAGGEGKFEIVNNALRVGLFWKNLKIKDK